MAQAFLSAGKTLVVGCRDGSIRIADTRASRNSGVATAAPTMSQPSAVCHVAALAEQHEVVCGDMSGGLSRWDLRACAVVSNYRGHVNSRTRLGFSVDQSAGVLCAVGEDGVVRLWDVRTARLLWHRPGCGVAPARNGTPAEFRAGWGGHRHGGGVGLLAATAAGGLDLAVLGL